MGSSRTNARETMGKTLREDKEPRPRTAEQHNGSSVTSLSAQKALKARKRNVRHSGKRRIAKPKLRSISSRATVLRWHRIPPALPMIAALATHRKKKRSRVWEDSRYRWAVSAYSEQS